MKNNQDYEVAEEISDDLPNTQTGSGVDIFKNQLDVIDKGITAFNTYQTTKRDIIESVEKTNRQKNQLDAEVHVISADIEKQRNKHDNEHKERMKDMVSVEKMVDNAIETNDKDKFKMMADLFQAKFTGQVSRGESDIDWNSNNNKLDF